MALRQCPICEVNYLRGDENICQVCAATKKRKTAQEDNEPVMCSECGELIATRPGELCDACWREQQRQLDLERIADKIRLAQDDSANENLDDDEIFVPEDAEPNPVGLDDALDGGLGLEL